MTSSATSKNAAAMSRGLRKRLRLTPGRHLPASMQPADSYQRPCWPDASGSVGSLPSAATIPHPVSQVCGAAALRCISVMLGLCCLNGCTDQPSPDARSCFQDTRLQQTLRMQRLNQICAIPTSCHRLIDTCRAPGRSDYSAVIKFFETVFSVLGTISQTNAFAAQLE